MCYRSVIVFQLLFKILFLKYMQTYGVIDIGSLKVKLLLSKSDGEFIEHLKKDSKLTLLGDGLKTESHKVTEKSLNDTVNAVKEYLEECEKSNTKEVKIVATEALRKAGNIDEIMNEFKRNFNLIPEIISQEEEALYLFNAALLDFPDKTNFGVIDIGGGSAQLITGEKFKINQIDYLPFGTYSMMQKFVSKENSQEGNHATEEELDKIIEFISSTLQNLSLDFEGDMIYGSSNVLDLVRFLKLTSVSYSHSKRHDLAISSSELKQFLKKINGMSYKMRELKYPFQYGYMWGIDIAFNVAIAAAAKLNSKLIIPSNSNIAEGIILELARS